jgi:hypothetical protein
MAAIYKSKEVANLAIFSEKLYKSLNLKDPFFLDSSLEREVKSRPDEN